MKLFKYFVVQLIAKVKTQSERQTTMDLSEKLSISRTDLNRQTRHDYVAEVASLVREKCKSLVANNISLT